MAVPTRGETYVQLIEHLRLAQEGCATLAHLDRANGDVALANGWLTLSELFKRAQHNVIELAKGRMQ